MKFIYILGCFYLFGCGSSGPLVSKSTNLIKEDCLELFQDDKWFETIKCLDQVADSNRNQSYFDLKGSALMKSGSQKEAILAFRQALDLDVNGENPYLHFKYGESLWQTHQFLLAGKAMTAYLTAVAHPNPEVKRQAGHYIRSAMVADSLYRLPRKFDPVPLSDSLNTTDDELGISMTYDRRQMILTRRENQEDLYQSHLRHGEWRKATPVHSLNSSDNEGAAALSGDGKMVVFTACQRPYGVGSCDLYYSMMQDTGWSTPELLPGVNSRFWDSQPTLSSDGRAIIFSSTRPGGHGGRDLWLSVQSEDGWIEPINLGPSINSYGNEGNPFLHSDEFTLYYTSDYWPGFGGRDLFMAHRIQGNKWSESSNLGYPVNSLENEEGVFIESSGQRGYFSSARGGQFDLYMFQVDRAIQPRPALLYELNVVDSVSGQPLKEVSMKVYDWTNDRLVRTVSTDAEGYAAFIMSGDREYGITLSRDDYTFYSYRKHMKEEVQEDVIDTVRLMPVSEKKTIILENVHFGSGEARLLSASHVELDQLAQYLMQNPELSIELSGHTDNIGQPEDNLTLSKDRAEAVKTYLTNQGVVEDNIKAVGKGESQPIASNDSSEGRQKNRRTEITIIENK